MSTMKITTAAARAAAIDEAFEAIAAARAARFDDASVSRMEAALLANSAAAAAARVMAEHAALLESLDFDADLDARFAARAAARAVCDPCFDDLDRAIWASVDAALVEWARTRAARAASRG